MIKGICYVCNKLMDDCQQNLTQIKSNHSGTQISVFIKNLLNGRTSHRCVDDETNCICEGCLEDIFTYDWMCMQVRKQEEKLRELLLSTETNSKIMVEVKREPPIDICHNETVFVEELIGLGEKSGIQVNTSQPKSNLLEKVARPMEETHATIASKKLPTPILETKPFPVYRELLLKKDGKLVKMRLLKTNIHSSATDVNRVIKLKAGDQLVSTKQVAVKSPTKQFIKNTSSKLTSPSIDALIQSTPILPSALVTPSKTSLSTECGNQTSHTENNLPVSSNIPTPHILKTKFRSECTFCNDGVVYTNKKFYDRHSRIHMKQKFCDKCDIKFTGMAVFRRHMKWHDNYPGFTCPHCHHQLEDKDSYKAHLEKHKNKERYSCVLCDKVFNEKRKLFYHVETHGERKHLCEQCGKTYSSKKFLQIHRTTHTEERTVKCLRCPKLFKNRSLMLYHNKVHNTERRFVCSVCGMKFKRKCHMAVHEKRHTEDTKTEKCQFCPAAFEQKYYLRDHIKRKHGAEVPKGSTETLKLLVGDEM